MVSSVTSNKHTYLQQWNQSVASVATIKYGTSKSYRLHSSDSSRNQSEDAIEAPTISPHVYGCVGQCWVGGALRSLHAGTPTIYDPRSYQIFPPTTPPKRGRHGVRSNRDVAVVLETLSQEHSRRSGSILDEDAAGSEPAGGKLEQRYCCFRNQVTTTVNCCCCF